MLPLYLHGFASTARSSKAMFFAGRFREVGLELHTPDLNLPDFSTLTITRMIQQVVDIVDAQPNLPVILIGSSLGAFVAVQVALVRPARIRSLILLAPALDFGPPTGTVQESADSRDSRERMESLGGVGVDEWKRTGRLNVFHYGYGRMMPLHYELYSDAARYDCVGASLAMPIQIFQGRRDTIVHPNTVERWARARPNVELHMLEDDHQLAASTGTMWAEMRRFIGV